MATGAATVAEVETGVVPLRAAGPAPPSGGARPQLAGAVGVDISARTIRVASGPGGSLRWHAPLPPGDVGLVCGTIAAAVQRLEASPRYIVVGTPGVVDGAAGTVSGATNLGDGWSGTIALRDELATWLSCEINICNDTTAALEAEKQRGGLVAAYNGALVTLSTGVGVALLVEGRDEPTEMGHNVLDVDGPPCARHPHQGCFESYLSGWALPLRYRELHPEFTGTSAADIPDDGAFWSACGVRLGELVLSICRLGRPLDAVSLIGSVALQRETHLLPAVRRCIAREAAFLPAVPRRLVVTPLGEDVVVLGAQLIARRLLFPFNSE